MENKEIYIVLDYIKDFSNRAEVRAFKDCCKVMECDLKIKLKQNQEKEGKTFEKQNY